MGNPINFRVMIIFVILLLLFVFNPSASDLSPEMVSNLTAVQALTAVPAP